MSRRGRNVYLRGPSSPPPAPSSTASRGSWGSRGSSSGRMSRIERLPFLESHTDVTCAPLPVKCGHLEHEPRDLDTTWVVGSIIPDEDWFEVGPKASTMISRGCVKLDLARS